MERVEVTSYVSALPDAVWRRISTAEGINHELRPWLRMTTPRGLRGQTLDAVPLRRPLGRSWVLLLGLIPFEFDDIFLAERGPGRRFLETSSSLTMRHWHHERVITETNGGSEVSDRLQFEPRGLAGRIPWIRQAMRRFVTSVFRHRHRRLTGYFSDSSGVR